MGHYNIVFKLFFFFPKLKFYFSTRKEGLQKFFFLTTNPNHTLTVKNFFFSFSLSFKEYPTQIIKFFIYLFYFLWTTQTIKLWLGLARASKYI